MFKIFEIRGKRFEYSNNIQAQKLSNPNPNIRDSRKKIRIQIESEFIRSPLVSICQLALSLLIEGGVRGLGDQPAGLEILPLRVRGGRPRGAGGHGARPRPGLGLEAVCSVAWSETRGDEL